MNCKTLPWMNVHKRKCVCESDKYIQVMSPESVWVGLEARKVEAVWRCEPLPLLRCRPQAPRYVRCFDTSEYHHWTFPSSIVVNVGARFWVIMQGDLISWRMKLLSYMRRRLGIVELAWVMICRQIMQRARFRDHACGFIVRRSSVLAMWDSASCYITLHWEYPLVTKEEVRWCDEVKAWRRLRRIDGLTKHVSCLTVSPHNIMVNH